MALIPRQWGPDTGRTGARPVALACTMVDTYAETEQPRAMTLTLSDWVYEGIVNKKSLLTMHPDYFLLSGGLERALCRIARKHAGKSVGVVMPVEVLRDSPKSSTDASARDRG